jgi:hypothetical protein
MPVTLCRASLLRDAGAVNGVSGLELALITGGFTLGAVAVTFAGNWALEWARERRAGRRERQRALAELLTAAVDLMSGTHAIRAAYEKQGGWRRLARNGGVLIAAIGPVLPPDGPVLRTRQDWGELLDWRRMAPMLDRLLTVLWKLDDRQRVAALDVNALLVARAVRFNAAVSALTLGEHAGKDVRAAVRDLVEAAGELLEAVMASPRKYARTRRRAERALAACSRAFGGQV